MKVRREVDRPDGRSISYSQLSFGQTCGLRLKFHRDRVKTKGIGIHLLYGRALHGGIDARAKGRARSDAEAVRMAIGILRSQVREQREPITWDEPWKTLKDGSPAADSYGSLCTPEVCEWWLERQVPLYLARYPDLQVVRAEHRIFVPLSQPDGAGWKHAWSLECWLDREMRDGSINDLKSSSDAWDEADFRKYRIQALIYMGAYYGFYKRPPAYFEFHVLPRMREGDAKGGFRAHPLIQTFRVEWAPAEIQRCIDSIVKPQITAIEAGVFVANPASRLCSRKWCQYWDWCSFGAGDHL